MDSRHTEAYYGNKQEDEVFELQAELSRLKNIIDDIPGKVVKAAASVLKEHHLTKNAETFVIHNIAGDIGFIIQEQVRES